jgi:hypothetical protein
VLLRANLLRSGLRDVLLRSRSAVLRGRAGSVLRSGSGSVLRSGSGPVLRSPAVLRARSLLRDFLLRHLQYLLPEEEVLPPPPVRLLPQEPLQQLQ